MSWAMDAKKSFKPCVIIFPSWNKLLLNAADRLDKEKESDAANLIRSQLKMNKPEFYLESSKIAQEYLRSLWFSFLQEQLNPDKNLVDDNQCGFYANPLRPEEFIDKIKPFIEQRELLETYKNNARDTAEKYYSRKLQLEKLIKILNDE